MPVVPIPDPIAGLIVTILASGAAWYKIIDGLKNMIPWVKDNPGVIKWINIIGNTVTIAGGCIVVGHVNDAFDVAKCLVAAVLASLTAAGFYEAKKASDLARAGGAAALTNVKAVAEVESNVVAPEPIVMIPPKKGR